MGEFGRGIGLLEEITVFLLDRSCLPITEFLRENQLEHLLWRVSHRVKAADNGTDRGAGHVVDRDIILLKSLYHTNMGGSFGAASA